MAAASQGQEDLVGIIRGIGHDADRAVQSLNGAAERLGHVEAGTEVPGNEDRDDLGIRGDLRRHLDAFEDQQFGVIVDVAVERAHDVGPRGLRTGFFAIERVGVGLGYEPDTGPPGVGHHCGPDPRRSQGAG